MQANATHDAEEIGVRLPVPTPVGALGPGEVGYLIAGIKDVGQARVGETVTTAARPAERARRATATRSRWCSAGSIPVDGDEYADLREALERLRLNDSSFTYEPETSGALGFGFRCGFLGLLHMEIVRERLEREYDLSLVATAPNVEYQRRPRRRARRGRRQPVGDAAAEPDRRRSRSRTSTSPCSRPPSTSGRSWSCASSGAAR